MPPEYVDVSGVKLAYERAGWGLPMLLITGFPRDRRLWRKLVPLLGHCFDTVAMDRRGYGESDRPTDPATYDNRTMAQDALELTQRLGWQRLVRRRSRHWLSSGQKIQTPVCVLWAAKGPVASAPVLELWQTVAENVCFAGRSPLI